MRPWIAKRPERGIEEQLTVFSPRGTSRTQKRLTDKSCTDMEGQSFKNPAS